MIWIPFIVLAALAAAFIVVPLVRKAKPPADRVDHDLQVYRDQLRELEHDVAMGLVSPAEEAAARQEIDRRVLGLSTKGYRRAGGGKIPTWRAALALAILIPLIAGTLYFVLGSPGMGDKPIANRTDLIRPVDDPDLVAFIKDQEAALKAKPDDGQGWVNLGRAYLINGRFQDAVDAVRKGIAAGANGPDEQMDLAEALVNVAGGVITPAAQEAVDAALKGDPSHPAARYYVGLARAQAGRTQEAFDIWLKLAGDTPAEAPWMPMLKRQLEGAAKTLKVDLAKVMPPPPDAGPFAGMNQEQQVAMIGQMVDRLAERMVTTPDDAQGWLRLAQSYRVLARYPEALDAVGKAVKLLPDDVEALAEQAGILLAATPPNAPFPDAAKPVLQKILTLDPDQAEALYYTGMAEAEAGHAGAAEAAWTRLLKQLKPDTGAYAEVKGRIDKLHAPAPAARP